MNSDLDGANMEGMSARSCSFHHTKLREARLKDADLRQCSFFKANLRRSDLRGADLRQTDIMDANVIGAMINRETKLPFSISKALSLGMVRA